MKFDWYLLKLLSGNENTDVWRAENSFKIDEICPLAIPNQIFTISMHIWSKKKKRLTFTEIMVRKRKYGRVAGCKTVKKLTKFAH